MRLPGVAKLTPRARLLLGCVPLLLGACGRFGFGVAPRSDAGLAPDADGRPAPGDLTARDTAASPDSATPRTCDGLGDGAPCDDDDICTAASTCRGGVCTPTGPAGSSCVVADSREEFGGQQGALGWWYGYWHAEVDPDGVYDPATDFLELVYDPDGQAWRPPDYDPDDTSPGFSWAYLAPYWEHPGGPPWARKVPVRRWISDVAGPAVVDIDFRMRDTGGGDGVTKSLLIDGVLVWSHHVEGTDGTPARPSIAVTLGVGTRVDFLLDAGANDAQDTCEFSALIRSP